MFCLGVPGMAKLFRNHYKSAGLHIVMIWNLVGRVCIIKYSRKACKGTYLNYKKVENPSMVFINNETGVLKMGAGIKKKPVVLKSGKIIHVAKKGYSSRGLASTGDISYRDREMDIRAQKAVEKAVEKTRILGKPIARYDRKTGTAYLEYADGRREDIE